MKIDRSIRRKRKVRVKVKKQKNLLRLSVFRSNKYIYTQVIDDSKGATLVSFSDAKLGLEKRKEFKTRTDIAAFVGEEIAKKALKKKISKVVFDRGGYRYHGIVKAVAEGARKGGLEF